MSGMYTPAGLNGSLQARCLILGIDQGAPSPSYESEWELDQCTDGGCTMSSTVCPASLPSWGIHSAGPCPWLLGPCSAMREHTLSLPDQQNGLSYWTSA